jgi:hypothetical protein
MVSSEQLHADIMLLELKLTYGLGDKDFDDLLCVLRKLLLDHNELPEKTYLGKKMICPIGLVVKKIHECSNDCILYHRDNKDLDAWV